MSRPLESLGFLQNFINKLEVRTDKYVLPDLLESNRQPADSEYQKYPPLKEFPTFTEATLCTWAFMNEHEVRTLLVSSNYEDIRMRLDAKLCHNYPKGLPRCIALELLYGAVKFAKSSQYDEGQTAALLSIFYLTHRYFNCCYRITAEDVFHFFKEILTHHSLEFVPTHTKHFEPKEAQRVFNYFCKVYLRHLPIIRLLGLPSFEFAINTTVPPFPTFKKKSDKKDKKGKEKGKKKSKK